MSMNFALFSFNEFLLISGFLHSELFYSQIFTGRFYVNKLCGNYKAFTSTKGYSGFLKTVLNI